jgi:hypothetical protein
MYDELIGELYLVASGVQSKNRRELLERAADAIEKLSKEATRWQEEAKDWYLAYMDLLPIPEPPKGE